MFHKKNFQSISRKINKMIILIFIAQIEKSPYNSNVIQKTIVFILENDWTAAICRRIKIK